MIRRRPWEGGQRELVGAGHRWERGTEVNEEEDENSTGGKMRIESHRGTHVTFF